MSDDLPTPTDAGDQKVLDDVRERGWHVVHVLEEDDTPGWSFTIGLLHNYGHPEILVFAVPHEAAHAILNLAGEAIRAGKVFEPDVPYDDFLEGYDCLFKLTDPRWYRDFVGYAVWFYQRVDFPVLQLFWPDREGVMPWEPNASEWQRANQPLLYESSVESAHVGALLATLDDA